MKTRTLKRRRARFVRLLKSRVKWTPEFAQHLQGLLIARNIQRFARLA